MAEFINTLAGITLLNEHKLDDLNASNVVNGAPLLKKLYAKPATNGTIHKYTRKTAHGGADFRNINSGADNDSAQREQVTHNLKFLDATVYCDIALADGYYKGRDAYLEMEAEEQLEAAFIRLEKQIIYGAADDSSNFKGLAGFVATLGNEMMINAGGTEAGNVKTSVYLIREGQKNCAVIAGNDGRIDMAEDPQMSKAVDAEGKPFVQYVVPVSGYFGLQVASTYDVVRICNITDEAGKGLNDDLLAEAISKFPSGKGPSFIVANRTTLKQLRNSRTATNPTGSPAPFPEEAYNVPLIVTDAITNAETIVAA